MSPVTVAHLRRPYELVSLNIERREPFAAPKYGAELDIDPYVELVQPFSEGDLNRDYKQELAESWERLSRVTCFDKQTVSDIWSILKATTAEDPHANVSPWRQPLERKRPVATAAHPRAYKGTKSQPPAAAQPPAVDLRPHLCNARDTREILRYLGDPLDDEARSTLDAFSFPVAFRRAFGLLPVFAPEKVSTALGLYWDLDLENNVPLRRCVALLVREPWSEAPWRWCEAVKSIDPSRRTATLELAIESLEYRWAASEYTDAIRRLSQISDDKQFCNRVWAVVQASSYKMSLAGLFAGFELANAYRGDFDFTDASYDESFLAEPIVEWAELVRQEDSEYWSRESTSLNLWTACGDLAGISTWLEQRPWVGLDSDAAFALVDPFLDCQYGNSPEACEKRLQHLLKTADQYVRTIRALAPDYRSKAIDMFRNAYWDSDRNRDQEIGRTLDLIPIVCCEPMLIDANECVYVGMLELDDASYEKFLASSPNCFRSFELATQSENDSKLVKRALITIAADEPALTVDAFQRCPSTLVRALKTLGCHAHAVRQEILKQWRQHALFDESADDLRELALHIEMHLPVGVHNPLPKKIRAFAHANWQLTEDQIARGSVTVRDNLFQTRVDLLRHIALEFLTESIRATGLQGDAAIEHAARLQNLSQENRRGLRKFLRAYLSGQHDYLDQHPANLRWMKEHSEIDAIRWQQGITLRKSLPHEGELVFSIEANPLEALRLGSYVNSCLGVGGMLAASAAAAVLDINKAVVYARNAKGKVVARQLLAIGDNDDLVCFEVYPTSSSKELSEAFCEYDYRLADFLEVLVYLPQPDEDAPKISRTVSAYWWDDGAWNLESE